MMAAIFAASASLFAGCDKDDPADKMPAVPTIALEDADIDAVHEIVDGIKVKVNVASPGKIADFAIKIESPVLTEALLGSLGLSTEMNLVTATGAMADGLKGLGFPVGDKVKDQTTLSFDISQLIPLIAQLPPQQTSDHNFVLTVTDSKGQKTTKTLKFHLTGTTDVTYNNDADLWTNTASLSVKLAAAGTPTVEYKASTAAEWQQAEVTANADGTYKAVMAPKWVSSKNDAQLEVHSIEAGTGIFAGATYKYRVLNGAETVAEDEFTTPAGDAIPNGDMSGWSKKQVTMDGENFYPITYPNAEGTDFWDSGNNVFIDSDDMGHNPLCYEANGAACLMPRLVLGSVFAPGNMFTGYFDYTGISGTAKFGQPYTWTARPRALKLRYKAKVDVIDKVGGYDPEAADYNGKQDRSCIFVAVVNWETQHGVTSGMVEPSGMWNPADANRFAEGPVLGYGQQIITETTGDWVELTIPLSWYDKAAANPSSAKFSLVISCATSMRGDYLTGSSKNEMYVDDFQWVY